ncbi:MAG: lysophospholipid acyltransferase family protein [Cyanobacteriota/Melainabacteria group bacterium]
MNRIISLCYALYFFLTAAVLYLVSLIILPLSLPFDERREFLHRLASIWGFHFIQLNPWWNCNISLCDGLDRKQNYVIVANHQSMADIFVLSGIPVAFKWVSKKSLFKIPFFGWLMYVNEYIPIERGDRNSIKLLMNNCRKWLLRGASIAMFAEGTRSPDGEIKEFKNGPFRLAADCNVPVLPIVIEGTRDIIRKHGRAFNFNANISVRVLEPVHPKDFNNDASRMRLHVQQKMTLALEKIRAKNQAPIDMQMQTVKLSQGTGQY